MVVFDKTGTITRGQPAVTDVILPALPAAGPASDAVRSELIRLAASVEKGSEHPLGEAVLARAVELDLPLSEPHGFRADPGRESRRILMESTLPWAIYG